MAIEQALKATNKGGGKQGLFQEIVFHWDFFVSISANPFEPKVS